MNKYKITLSKKALIAIILILLPLLVVFIYTYEVNKRLIKKIALDDITNLADAYESQVYQSLREYRDRAKDFSSDGLIRQTLEGRAQNAGVILSAHLTNAKMPLYKQINAIHVTTKEGRVIASTSPSAIGKNISDELFFKNISGGTDITETSAVNGVNTIAVTAPVKTKDGAKISGFVTIFFDISDIQEILSGAHSLAHGALQARQGARKTLEVYIVNKDKQILINTRAGVNASKEHLVDTLPVRKCIENGEETTAFYNDYDGDSVAGSSMCIRSLKWTLLVEIDEDEIMLPITQVRNNAVIAAAAVMMITLLLFMLFYKTVVLQLRRMANATKDFVDGNYNITLPITSTDELGHLAESFNHMFAEVQSRSTALTLSEANYRSLISNMPDVAWTADAEGNIAFISPTIKRLLGYTTDEFLTRSQSRFANVHPEDVERVKAAYTAFFRDKVKFDVEYRMSRMDGEWIWLHDRAVSTYAYGGMEYADGIFSNITERKLAVEALKKNEARLKRAQSIAHIGSWDWDIVQNTLYWSDEVYNIFDAPQDGSAVTYEEFIQHVHPDDREFVKTSVLNAVNDNAVYSIDHRIVRPDGKELIVHENGEVSFDSAGKPVRMIGTVQDVTEKRRTEFELKKLSLAMEHSVNIIFITNLKGVIEYVNPMFEQITEYSEADAIGQTPKILSTGEIPKEDYAKLWNTLLSGKTWRNVYKNKKKGGGIYWCNSVVSPIKDENGKVTHFLAVQEDITEKMITEEKINYLANYDELSGLINRNRFIQLLEDWINTSEPDKAKGALLLADMDQFKLLNDTFGHGVGDEFLRRSATLINKTANELYQRFVNDPDKKPFISRLSSDEFMIFLPNIDEREGVRIAEFIRTAVSEQYYEEAECTMTMSIGLVMYPRHASNTRMLFTRADAAMYRAKELGRNRTHVYNPEDRDLENMMTRLNWKEKIQKALKDDRFDPWFQPLLDMKTGMIHHYESLARMRDEDGTILMPFTFIDIAERFDLIGQIDRMIIGKTMVYQAEMLKKGVRLSFGMNLSGKDLGDAELVSFIKEETIKTGANPECLIFEITETAAIKDFVQAVKFIKDLKAIGCRFSLDDFGVGFTSFNYLRELHVDYIKIDGAFIKKLRDNKSDQVFVKAITDMAKGLGIQSVAEFVETEEVLELLRGYEVDYAQGYHIGKPAPATLDSMTYINKGKTPF